MKSLACHVRPFPSRPSPVFCSLFCLTFTFYVLMFISHFPCLQHDIPFDKHPCLSTPLLLSFKAQLSFVLPMESSPGSSARLWCPLLHTTLAPDECLHCATTHFPPQTVGYQGLGLAHALVSALYTGSLAKGLLGIV